jgi:hypothetical protein
MGRIPVPRLEREAESQGTDGFEHFSDKGRTEHIVRALYKFPSIPPNARINLTDYIFLKGSSIIQRETNARTKDGVPVVIPWKLHYGFPITFTVDGEDVLPSSGKVNLHCRSGDIENFSTVKREENRLIKEMRSGVRKGPSGEVAFIGFKNFSKHPVEDGEGEPIKILGAVPASMMGANGRITSRGLITRGKPTGFTSF